jgi:hypothetical protein
MKVRIEVGPKAGQVVDIVATADTFLMIMCGSISEVKPEPMDWRKQCKNGTAQWKAGFTGANDRRPCITAKCDVCNAYQLFLENDRIVNATTGRIPPSTLPQAFLEHCGKKEKVPADVLKAYEKMFDVVME